MGGTKGGGWCGENIDWLPSLWQSVHLAHKYLVAQFLTRFMDG